MGSVLPDACEPGGSLHAQEGPLGKPRAGRWTRSRRRGGEGASGCPMVVTPMPEAKRPGQSGAKQTWPPGHRVAQPSPGRKTELHVRRPAARASLPRPLLPASAASGGRLWTRSFNPSAPWPTPCGVLYLSPRVALAKDYKQGGLKHHGHLSSWSVSLRPNLPLLTRTPGTGLGAHLP